MNKTKQKKQNSTLKPTSVNSTDHKILNLLSSNSRLSSRAIAKTLSLSTVTVLKHLKKLQHTLIKNFTTKIDYDALGYDLHVMISLRVSRGRLASVEKKIATHPNVLSVYDTTGDFDTLIIARFKSRRSLDTFLKKIQKIEHVQRTHTRIILNTIVEKQLEIK